MHSVKLILRETHGHADNEKSHQFGRCDKSIMESSDSNFLDGPFPTVVTDHFNRVIDANRLLESSIEIPLGETRGQNLFGLISRINCSISHVQLGTHDQPDSKAQDRGWTLELEAITDSKLIWKLIQTPDVVSAGMRVKNSVLPEMLETSGVFARVDSAETTVESRTDRIISHSRSTSSREEVTASLEQERIDSLLPRLTSLFGHLDFVKYCADKVEMPHLRQLETKLTRSINIAQLESVQIAKIVREIRGLRRSIHAHQKSHNFQSLVDRCLRILDTELDAQEIELQFSDRMKKNTVTVITDDIAVCQAILWLIRKAATDLSFKERRILTDCSMEDGQLKLGVSFKRSSNMTDQPSCISGLLNLPSKNVGSNFADSRIRKPSAATTWYQTNLPNGRSTITASVPCIEGIK